MEFDTIQGTSFEAFRFDYINFEGRDSWLSPTTTSTSSGGKCPVGFKPFIISVMSESDRSGEEGYYIPDRIHVYSKPFWMGSPVRFLKFSERPFTSKEKADIIRQYYPKIRVCDHLDKSHVEELGLDELIEDGQRFDQCKMQVDAEIYKEKGRAFASSRLRRYLRAGFECTLRCHSSFFAIGSIDDLERLGL